MQPDFQPKKDFGSATNTYQILPFRFMRLNTRTNILVNEVGEYLHLNNETFSKFVAHSLDVHCDAYLALKSKHFLADSALKTSIDLLATKYRTKKAFLSGFTKLHIFVVSLRCDHSCHYCQVSRVTTDKIKYDMSAETATKAVNLMFQTTAKEIKVEFQGGESLLAFDVIRFIVELIIQRNLEFQKKIEFVIATNLSNLTDEMLEFFRLHRICLSTSLDGPEFLHNANRPRPGNDSYARTVANIQRARDALGHDRVSALMTTTQLSLKYPREIVDEYIRQRFDSIFLRSISPYGFAMKTARHSGHSLMQFLDFYREVLDYIISINKKGTFFSETYAQILLTKILTPWSTGYVDLQSPAGAGIGVVVYNYDGDVYASDESRMLAEMGDREFKLGNVHENTYQEMFGGQKLQTLVAASCVEALPGCADCAFQTYCGADPVFNYATQGTVFGHRPTSEFCSKNMAIIKHLLQLIESGEQETLDVLWSWIRNVPVSQLTQGILHETA
jgi:uncharacterized protein